MRPAPINIGPLPRAHLNVQSVAARFFPKPRAEFCFEDGRKIRRPALQGWAALYDTAFEHRGRYVYIREGALRDSIYSGTEKFALLDHDAAKNVGSTNDGLEFAGCLEGVAFRLPLDTLPKGHELAEMVSSGRRACCSVGVKYQEYETKTFSGEPVDIVSKADLVELSLVWQGAITNTFATLVDLEEEEPILWSAARTAKFKADMLTANTQARARRITALINKAMKS